MPPPTFNYDVFISYSSLDKDWVRKVLLPRLEKAGLKAFIDYRDFTRGAPSIKECERGVVECHKTLLVLTPNYVASGWTEFENIMAQTLDPANQTLRMIPLLKSACKKPPRIGLLTHIDFTDEADDDEHHTLGWRQLMVALGGKEEGFTPKVAVEPHDHDWHLVHPFAMPEHFTGRQQERGMLSNWLMKDEKHPLMVLRALGGFGKSALAWHWLLKDVDPKVWPRVVWWSFYEPDASFETFVEETLRYLSGKKVDGTQLRGKEAVSTLLKLLKQPGTLLVLDGFERELRAFGGLGAAYQGDVEKNEDNGRWRESKSPLADGFLYSVALTPGVRSKVLLTTRLRPQALEAKGAVLLVGCHEEELKQLEPSDALEFFQAMGIRGTPEEIATVCAHYGCHPLSLRLLAGLIVADFQQPGDIAAARRLDVTGSLVQRRHHVLEASYEGLTPEQQTLLSHIACLRSLVTYEAMLAITTDMRRKGGYASHASISASLDANLRALVARGLLNHDRKIRQFDLHPIVRRYTYDRLTASDRSAAHTRLCDYFSAVPKVQNVTRLEDLMPIIELYHHTVSAGRLDEAFTLYQDRLRELLYFQLGSYGLIIEMLRMLFPDGEQHAPRLKKKDDQAWALSLLANACCRSGQPRRAVPLFEQQIAICEMQGDKKGCGIGLVNLAQQQRDIGALRVATTLLRRSIELCRKTWETNWEAAGHKELGRLLAVCGVHAEAEKELKRALDIFEGNGQLQAQCLTWADRVQLGLLRQRSTSNTSEGPNPGDSAASGIVTAARFVLHLADRRARKSHPVECDYVRANWLLGAALRLAGMAYQADLHLGEALQRCRRIDLVDHEPDILIDLARLRAAAGDTVEAQRLAEEALSIADRAGYVLAGADAHLELAKLALGRGERDVALTHAQEALDLATCDGSPHYTYRAAYDEAGALLEELQV